jgi:hypothetical protein
MITNKELLKLVKYKLGLFELDQEITDEDLQHVYELVISNVSLSGKLNNIDLSQLSEIPNLQSLDLYSFDIGKEFADALSSLKQLESLRITRSNVQAPIECGTLSSLIIESSRVGNYQFLPVAKEVEFIEQGVNMYELSAQEGVTKRLCFYGGSIKKAKRIREYTQLESAVFDRVKLDDANIPRKLKESGIDVEYEKGEFHLESLFLE